ncbi:MAG TPA: hypothetical protein PLE77_02720 [Kiritimatiellia bacterium]|nr:hypothetical protein [Kiritimatiellia bacterium]
MTRRSMFLMASAAMFAAGILITVQALRLTPESARQIRSRIDTLEKLRVLQAGCDRETAAIELYEKLPQHTPAPLDNLLRSAFPGIETQQRLRESRPLAEGWTLRSVEVTIDRIRLADLSRLLDRVSESGNRPPWRLAELNISAQDQVPGFGRATLVLEALEKKSGSR